MEFKHYETGPYHLRNVVAKRTTPPACLSNSIRISLRLGQSNMARTTIRKVLVRYKGESQPIHEPCLPYFLQLATGNDCTQMPDEFYQLAKNTNQPILHVTISSSLDHTIDAAVWQQIIQYCLHCWGHSASPTLVISPPTHEQVDLFILQESCWELNALKTEEKWVVQQMMGIQVALWVTKPAFYTTKLNRLSLNQGDNGSYSLFIARAIYDSLTEQRLSTIHQLVDYLLKGYYIETEFQAYDLNFSKLRFRYKGLYWLAVHELSVSELHIRIWLQFNRLAKTVPFINRIVDSFDYKPQSPTHSSPVWI